MTELTADMVVDSAGLGDPQVCRNGWIAYTVAPASKREEHEQRAIWVVNASGTGVPQQFTAGVANDTSPRWSSDGGSLAFLSDREERGTAQVYLMRRAGGEARQLTYAKRGVAAFAWSPDDQHIAYTALDDPTEEDERRERERDDAHVYGERLQFHKLRVLNVHTGSLATIVDDEREITEFAWAPDGMKLAFISRRTTELDVVESGPATLQRVNVDGGGGGQLCPLQGLVWGLTWTSDARWILFGREVDALAQGSFALFRVASEGGDPDLLTGGESACILGLHAVPGQWRAVALVAEGLQSMLAWVDPDTGDVETLYRPEAGGFYDWSVHMQGGHLVVAVCLEDGQMPAEIFAGDPSDGLGRLTNHHPEFALVQFGEQTDFYWNAPDGLELDGIVVLPPGLQPGDPLPGIVLVHGGPYGRWARGFHLSWAGWAQWLAVCGYAVLMPNPRGGAGHGHRFASSCRGDVGGLDWGDVQSAVDAAVERGIMASDRLGIGGWSQGGFMSAWAVTQSDRFKAAIDGAGPTDWGMMAATSDMPTFEAALGGSTVWDGPGPHRHAQISPISFARNVTTPTLILHGERDERVPVSQAISFHRALRHFGASVEMVIYPREPHPILERAHQLDILHRVREWFLRYIPPHAHDAETLEDINQAVAGM